MKDFFKSLFASILGCFVVIAIFLLIGLGIIVALAFGSSDNFTLKENTVLNIRLEGILSERVEEKNPLLEMIIQSPMEIGLDDILSSIKKAKENDKIKGIYIYSGLFSASPASLKEMRDALVDFKESGKFIVSYSDLYLQDGYYLSSVSDEMIINPQGVINLHGLSVSRTFYKGLLEKLGVEVQIFKVGTFKSAVEPFILDKMSDANKEQLESYMSDMWNTTLTDISDSRNISVGRLNLITDSLPALRKTEMYIGNDLVDTLMYEIDVEDYIKSKLGVDKDEDLQFASVDNMISVPNVNESKSEDIIAVVYASGEIMTGLGNGGIDSKHYVKELKELEEDDKVKAVVLRVNSPGGGAYASEQIWKAVSDLKDKKPVVVSMGDYAASGGYYISCVASKIVAQPNTLTGSIGIFGMFPDVEGLIKKVGLAFDQVGTNRFSDFGEFTRPMRDDEKEIMQTYVNNGYELFLKRCSEGRNIPVDSIAKIAEGRVWTGNQALKIGLVDEIGGIDKAIEEAAKLAELSDYQLEKLPKKTDFFESFIFNQKQLFIQEGMKEYLGEDYKIVETLKKIKEQDYIQARLPYDLKIQ